MPIDFGFGLSPSSRVNLDNADGALFEKLALLEPTVRECMACGSCSAVCTASKFKDTSLRRAILSLQNGQDRKALQLLEGCLLCGKCTMVCPRGINTRNLILRIVQVYGK